MYIQGEPRQSTVLALLDISKYICTCWKNSTKPSGACVRISAAALYSMR